MVVYCKDCACKRTRNWARTNPGRVKATQDRLYKEKRQDRLNNWRIYRYGVTPERFEQMKREQGNKCKICYASEPGGMGDWHVDHDHETNVVRALLCHYCNTGLGKFKDSVELLLKAAAYLDHHKQLGDATCLETLSHLTTSF